APAVDVVVKGAADAPVADVVGEGAADSNTLTVTSPSNGATISGTVVFKGQAGSEWVNVAAYDETSAGAMVGSNVKPSNGAFAILVDTTQLASGMTSFAIKGFSVPAGQSGGTSRSVALTVNIANPAQGLVYGANLHANGDY